MRKVRNTLSIVIPAFAILGILAVSGHAKKPSPPPEPTVTVTGAIRVTFDKSLAYDYPGEDATGDQVFISNPDYPPSLHIALNSYRDAPHIRKDLTYYYCAGQHDAGESICNNQSHDPYYYYCLVISGGITQNKNPNFTDHVVFPVDSPWCISWKYDNSTVVSGRLKKETTYDVIE
jgi:hypothetical protein